MADGILVVDSKKNDVPAPKSHSESPKVLCRTISRGRSLRLPAGKGGTSVGSSYGAIWIKPLGTRTMTGFLDRTTLRAMPLNLALATETVSICIQEVRYMTRKWSSLWSWGHFRSRERRETDGPRRCW